MNKVDENLQNMFNITLVLVYIVGPGAYSWCVVGVSVGRKHHGRSDGEPVFGLRIRVLLPLRFCESPTVVGHDILHHGRPS